MLSKLLAIPNDLEIEKNTQEMELVAKLTQNLIKQNSMTPMKQEVYHEEYGKLVERYDALKAKRDALLLKKEMQESKVKFIQREVEILRETDAITGFSNALWINTIDHVTVCEDGDMVFCFKDGTEIRV